tara:strand:- start:812 stop:1519 length:708 start_codon:yes stop_codon:yes gene_type:complete
LTKKINLKNVTLLAASSINIDSTQDALMISSYKLNFSSIKLLSPSKPKNIFDSIEYIQIPDIDLKGYNKLILNELYNYFNTSHCLVVQSDAFVINPEIWTDEFLNYDYIGAPWTKNISPNNNISIDLKKNRVGNGGFSLRSKKLTNITKDYEYSNLKFPVDQEDVIICHYLFEELIKENISFAPIDLAAKFSVEHPQTNSEYGINDKNVFGFHGKHLQKYFKNRFIKNRDKINGK